MELGQAQVFPPEWMERFFPGMPITGDVDAYPPLADLLAQLEISHTRLSALIPPRSAEDLKVEPKIDLVRRRYTSVRQFATDAMTAHEGVHLGQVADIRRALGLENTDL